MNKHPAPTAIALALLLAGTSAAQAAEPPPRKSASELLAASPAGDWRALDPENTLLMELEPRGQQVLIELAPRFAPRHAANIRVLARGGYFDGLAVLRVQDNFVAQWGDPDGDAAAKARPLGQAEAKLPAEFSLPLKGLPLTRLPDADGWAPVTGFVDGFAVAADPARDRAWLAHCYGVVGVARGNAPDSGNGSALYTVIGHAPRSLDLNITVVGRVLKGIEHLSSLPRGGGHLGFYEQASERQPIRRARLLAELPAAERPALQVLRSDSSTFAELLDARRWRSGWFVHSPGHIEICSASVPTRALPAAR